MPKLLDSEPLEAHSKKDLFTIALTGVSWPESKLPYHPSFSFALQMCCRGTPIENANTQDVSGTEPQAPFTGHLLLASFSPQQSRMLGFLYQGTFILSWSFNY